LTILQKIQTQFRPVMG